MISLYEVFIEIVDQEEVASSQGAMSTIKKLNGSGETCSVGVLYYTITLGFMVSFCDRLGCTNYLQILQLSKLMYEIFPIHYQLTFINYKSQLISHNHQNIMDLHSTFQFVNSKLP